MQPVIGQITVSISPVLFRPLRFCSIALIQGKSSFAIATNSELIIPVWNTDLQGLAFGAGSQKFDAFLFSVWGMHTRKATSGYYLGK